MHVERRAGASATRWEMVAIPDRELQTYSTSWTHERQKLPAANSYMRMKRGPPTGPLCKVEACPERHGLPTGRQGDGGEIMHHAR